MKYVKTLGIALHAFHLVMYFLIVLTEDFDYTRFIFFLFCSSLCIPPIIMYLVHWSKFRIDQDYEMAGKTLLDSHLGNLCSNQKQTNLYPSSFSPLKFLSVLSSLIHLAVFFYLVTLIYSERPDNDILIFVVGIILIYLSSAILNLFYVFRITYPIIRPGAN